MTNLNYLLCLIVYMCLPTETLDTLYLSIAFGQNQNY